ncbi:MAG: penicillin-binding protein 2 [Butyrivibrio sp.]|nr:penicillin-binding protein 2 [Butyrivibrio sp.]
MKKTTKHTDRNDNNKEKFSDKPYPIIIISVFFSAVFICLISYICWYSYNNKQDLVNNSHNTRQAILLAQNSRGSIYSSDGQVLAETTTDSEGNESRNYPFGDLFSHIVGYSTNGKAGIESLANYYLINTSIDLSKKVEAQESGTKFPGDSVYTSLDVNLQQIAYNQLSAYKGAVIVSEPKTGKILAMVSKPGFDPNNIEKEWDSLINSDGTELLNRATQGLYPPGSTFKIMTSLEYIRENPSSYNNYSFNCTGSFTSGTDTIKCYHGENHGTLDFFSSFAKSCNSSFANIGLSLDRSSFGDTLSDLMFNDELPLELNYSKSSATCNESMSTSDMMQLAIGQGTTSMTPMHLNMITCAIANGGTLMKPSVINDIESADGKVVESYSPTEYKKLMSSEEASILTEMMKGVVETGTASRLKGLSYTAAGKTGSAEFKESSSDSHAWFTGFAPAEDPQICVTIIIENAGSGGEYAVPLAKRLFDAYLEN